MLHHFKVPSLLALSLTLFSVLPSTTASPTHGTTLLSSRVSAAPPLPFNLTYLFTATLNVGGPFPVALSNTTADHISTLDGAGVVVPEPIINGTVSGPYINATITSGFALPTVYSLKGGKTLQVPTIEIYGVTDDGVGLFIHEVGIGSPQAQMTRIEMSIGGGDKYATLREGYILTSVNPNAARTIVTARGYLVQNTAHG